MNGGFKNIHRDMYEYGVEFINGKYIRDGELNVGLGS